MSTDDLISHTHGDGNCHLSDDLLKRLKEIDDTFKVTFLVHDELGFECREENREAIVQALQDDMLEQWKLSRIDMTVDWKVEF